jgi:hypothetical protein
VSVAIDDRPVTTSAGQDDDDFDHIICCDDNVAMCGRDVTLDEWSENEENPECPLCTYLWDSGLPCPVAGCKGGQ